VLRGEVAVRVVDLFVAERFQMLLLTHARSSGRGTGS
jgi:hypothetical protein